MLIMYSTFLSAVYTVTTNLNNYEVDTTRQKSDSGPPGY